MCKGDNLKVLKTVILLCFLFSLVSPVMGADEQKLTKTDKDGNVVDATYSSSDKSVSSEKKKEKEEEDTAKKIYSDEYVLGFKKGDGSITDITPEESMKVISSSDVVWAIIIVFFLLGLGLCIFGYFGTIIINVLKAIWATLFNENAEDAMDKVSTSRRSTRKLTFAAGEGFLFAAVMFYVIFNLW